MNLLAIETSCDDTCAAVLSDGAIASNVIASQHRDHEAFGGIVPEVASRRHVELINPTIEAALEGSGLGLDDIDGLAVTRGPGLVGALLVGLMSAKAIAAPRRLPLWGIDHLHGHAVAGLLAEEPFEPPHLSLIASGGHTLLAAVADRGGYEILGRTLDDAAGEALDKGARLLGLGFPGGPAIERAAAGGDPFAFDLPHGKGRVGLDFSFSGLKTALLYTVRDLGEGAAGERVGDLAASYQEAVVGQLADRLARAIDEGGWGAVSLGGGVAANSRLRERVTELCEERGVRLCLVPGELCTDNAAMIGAAALGGRPAEHPDYLDWEVWA